MVTLLSPTLSEFDLHSRAIVGLADALALATPDTHADVRIFGKPITRPYRRMGVTLARVADGNINKARAVAVAAASRITIKYNR
jgi:phosphoribosylglycinamide formyltransferase 2